MSKQRPARAKKPARRKKQRSLSNLLARAVTVLAVIMAAAYIIVRIINWIRFL